MHSPSHVVKITEIVKKLKSGIEFYTAVIYSSAAPKYQSVFRRMWDEKQRAVKALSPFCNLAVNEEGEASNICTDLHQRYITVLKDISENTDGTSLKPLTDIESTIIDAIDDALNDSQPSETAACLRLVRTRAQQCCDEIHALYNTRPLRPV